MLPSDVTYIYTYIHTHISIYTHDLSHTDFDANISTQKDFAATLLTLFP